MGSNYKNIFKKFVMPLLIVIGIWFWQQTPVHASPATVVTAYENYNCSDFGSRERAQSEFYKYSFDKYGLDGDGDGQVCEWNPSTGNWDLIAAGSGLLVGRYVGKRKRFGAYEVVPFPKGLFFDWQKRSDDRRVASFEGTNVLILILGVPVSYLLMTVLRDRVYSIGTPPSGLIATAFTVGFGLTYWIASARDNWI